MFFLTFVASHRHEGGFFFIFHRSTWHKYFREVKKRTARTSSKWLEPNFLTHFASHCRLIFAFLFLLKMIQNKRKTFTVRWFNTWWDVYCFKSNQLSKRNGISTRCASFFYLNKLNRKIWGNSDGRATLDRYFANWDHLKATSQKIVKLKSF